MALTGAERQARYRENRRTNDARRADEIEIIDIVAIRRDVACQPRVDTDNTVIEEYAAAMREGAKFPPIVVFGDGPIYWLADGFYRTAASESAGRSSIEAEIHEGGRREAILYSVGVNASHGVRRTNADKERAIKALLEDPEWKQWSDREIARRCIVDNKTVARLRVHLRNSSDDQPRTVKRGDKTFEMKTAGIGKHSDPKSKKTRAKTRAVIHDVGVVAMINDFVELLRDERPRIERIPIQTRVLLVFTLMAAIVVSMPELNSFENGEHDLPSPFSPPHPPITPTSPSVEPDGSTGALAPIDPIKALWDRGKAILGNTPQARSLLGKMRKRHGNPIVLAAIVQCEAEAPSDPAAYFVRCCDVRGTDKRQGGPVTNLIEGFGRAAGLE